MAADFNGDGYADLYVTTAGQDKLLWNDGNGTAFIFESDWVEKFSTETERGSAITEARCRSA